MPRSVGNDMCLERKSYQGKVAYYIEELMPGRFIWEPEFKIVQYSLFTNLNVVFIKNLRNPFNLVVGYGFINNHYSVVNVAAFYQVIGQQPFQFMKE